MDRKLYKVYVRMPYPDYKRPSISETTFYHEDKELALTVYHALILYHLEGYIDWKSERDDDDWINEEEDNNVRSKKLEELVQKFMEEYDDYLYQDSYMDETPEFIFEEYKPPTNSTELPSGASYDPRCIELFKKYQ